MKTGWYMLHYSGAIQDDINDKVTAEVRSLLSKCGINYDYLDSEQKGTVDLIIRDIVDAALEPVKRSCHEVELLRSAGGKRGDVR